LRGKARSDKLLPLDIGRIAEQCLYDANRIRLYAEVAVTDRGEMYKLNREFPQQVPVIRTISPDDEMLAPAAYGEEQYFSVGASALENILAALAIAGRASVESILDLPCGHGRVTRYLRAAFPRANICACDTNRDGVDFCVAQFGVEPFYSSPEFKDVHLNETFDMIWSGSLFTHLNRERFEECFDFYIDHLSDNGVLVFSVHGRYSTWLQHHGFKYLPDERFEQIMQGYEQAGFGYADYNYDYYADEVGYGISITKPSWIASMIERNEAIRLLFFKERAWLGHHDIVACVKTPIFDG